MLIAFLTIILLPLALPEPPEGARPLAHFTPFANYMLWGLWFPLVLLSVVFTGRSWCGLLCPMGATSEWISRYGLQRPVPRWLRWEGMPLLSFIVVTILGQTVGVRDHPEAAAGIFGGTFVAAVLAAGVYGRGKRVWCRHLCLIELLLGIFHASAWCSSHPRRPSPAGSESPSTVCARP